MCTVLNRCRGQWGWAAKGVGVLLGLLVFATTHNFSVALACGIGYIIGESMGWGDWLGGLVGGHAKLGDEGKGNGIRWLAKKIISIDDIPLCSYSETVRKYNIVALIIRGFYWWIPALLPLCWVTNPFEIFAAITLLALLFPVSAFCSVATRFTAGWFVPDAWARSEIFYGIFQDLILGLVFMHIILGA